MLLYRLAKRVRATNCSGIRYIFAAPVNTTAPKTCAKSSDYAKSEPLVCMTHSHQPQVYFRIVLSPVDRYCHVISPEQISKMRKVYVVSLLFNLETFQSSLGSVPDVQCCRLIVAITNRL